MLKLRGFAACRRGGHSGDAQERHHSGGRPGRPDSRHRIPTFAGVGGGRYGSSTPAARGRFSADQSLWESLSKEQYLGAVASGEIDYLVWEPEAIEVRLSGEMALIRYTSRLELVAGGQGIPLRHYWHTDSYERREGHWQAVWS